MASSPRFSAELHENWWCSMERQELDQTKTDESKQVFRVLDAATASDRLHLDLQKKNSCRLGSSWRLWPFMFPALGVKVV